MFAVPVCLWSLTLAFGACGVCTVLWSLRVHVATPCGYQVLVYSLVAGPTNTESPPEDGKLKSETIVKDNRRYYLDLKENQRGRFLRVMMAAACLFFWYCFFFCIFSILPGLTGNLAISWDLRKCGVTLLWMGNAPDILLICYSLNKTKQKNGKKNVQVLSCRLEEFIQSVKTWPKRKKKET